MTGEALVKQGTAGDSPFIIKSGDVGITGSKMGHHCLSINVQRVSF